MKQERQERRSWGNQELREELTLKSTEQRKETPSSHSSCFLCFCHESRDSSSVPVSDCEAEERAGSVKDSLVLTKEKTKEKRTKRNRRCFLWRESRDTRKKYVTRITSKGNRDSFCRGNDVHFIFYVILCSLFFNQKFLPINQVYSAVSCKILLKLLVNALSFVFFFFFSPWSVYLLLGDCFSLTLSDQVLFLVVIV